jgi:uncharacterized protein (DUF2252 family)
MTQTEDAVTTPTIRRSRTQRVARAAPPTPAERAARGGAARLQVPPATHAEFGTPADRPDPVALLVGQGDSRVTELVPIRYGRMLVSPFTFYRGAAAVMAADLAATPTSGISVQACGDAHVSNFGIFGSPERAMLFDINDFDETYPGPWEWDVKRLAASFVVAGRENGFTVKERRRIVRATVARYQAAMGRFASMRDLDVWYARVDAGSAPELLSKRLTKAQLKRLGKNEAKARTRDSMQAYGKLVGTVDGQPRITADPPLIVPISDLLPTADRISLVAQIEGLLSRYRRSLPSDRRVLLEKFSFVDLARKVVGVGSVGTRCWIVLLQGRDGADPLFLQVKEAQRSVLADHVRADHVKADHVKADHVGGNELPTFRNEGQRVVAGQRLMQAASDIFLGWDAIEGLDGQRRDFYVRQLRDWKGSIVLETMPPQGMAALGELCGWTLARAHARSGDRIAIGAYLGDDDAFAKAIADFSELYADQNELDYAALAEAGRTGRIQVRAGL